MNCFWNTVFIAFYVFFYVAQSSVLPTITVILNETVTLPFSGSCDGFIEWKHRHESKSGVTHTTVSTLHQGDFTPGVGFENRVKRGGGDLYLNISSVVFNDNGWFECHCGKTQEDVQFVVLVPIVVGKPAYIGSNFQLNFYGFTKKQTPDSEVHVYCEKDGQTVLNVTAGNITYGPRFENWDSGSNDAYRHGHISLPLTDLHLSDQGTYQCLLGPDHQRGIPGAVTLNITPKEKHCDDTGRPTMVEVVIIVLVIILVAVIFYFLGGRLKETMADWFKGNCLRSQLSPCPEGEQGGEHLSVTISESESETEEDRIGTRTCFVPYAPSCIIRALSGPPSTAGLVTKTTDGPPSTPGLVTNGTDGPPSTPGLVTKATDGPPSNVFFRSVYCLQFV